MGFSKMRAMLTEVGCPIESVDLDFCFHTFDVSQNGYISREDFSATMELSADEEDEAIIMAQDFVNQKISGTSRLKHGQLFIEMFQMINSNGDGILSLSEIINFYAQLGIFLTPSEGRHMMQIMDVKGKDRLEEVDFVAFMTAVARDGAQVRRAFRIREAGERIRRWLIRSINLSSASSTAVTSEPVFWRDLRISHSASRGGTFPGYLYSNSLWLLTAKLGHRLSTNECKQLCLVIAPTKNGRVHLTDLVEFMNSSCRQFGELLALLERDILKPVVGAFKDKKLASDKNDEAKLVDLEKEFAEILREIESNVSSAAGGLQSDQKGSVGDIVSLTQVKAGVQSVMQ